jgi:hypothetical protein
MWVLFAEVEKKKKSHIPYVRLKDSTIFFLFTLLRVCVRACLLLFFFFFFFSVKVVVVVLLMIS